jgi:homoserine O-succinyltransferase/O-acetyltransferase
MIEIAIVNNMPPAAIQPTEIQFTDLLTAAGQDAPINIRWFRLQPARPSSYEPLENLWCSRLDAMIVTGAEPRSGSLLEESIWPMMVKTIDWAAENTVSTIFSCLAAHAAVLHLDGIERRPRMEKIFGVFDSYKITNHPLLADTPERWQVPHSRWNDLTEEDLEACGYEVLARSPDAGVDLFTKTKSRSLFLFMQTHPEYFPDTLLRELRRDIARFRNGQQSQYPSIPRSYFSDSQVSAFRTLLNEGCVSRDAQEGLLLNCAETPESWKEFAVQLYRNWIFHIQARVPLERTAA